jgi:glutamate/tyrosine decarboxylase-like PLP-dependent enzyme
MTSFARELVQEETLDPADWEGMRRLGHRMVDDMMGWLEHVRERPVWQPIPEQARTAFRRPAPREPEGAEQAYRDFLTQVLPHPMGNIHPRFWGWVMGTGTPLGALAELLAATMNPNCGGGDHIATEVETQVLAWCKEMLGFPSEASGILVSGGSMANLVALTVARNEGAGFDIRAHGVGAAPQPLRLYGSSETHSSVQKAVELLGLGSEAFRQIPVNGDYEVDVEALQAAITADRAAGCRPVCVIGNAGTVNTGAIDDLARLAELCRRERLWFHVDGAFGALAALAPALAPRLRGMEQADSIAFDLHKWMYLPFEAGCALVRRPEAHRNAFALTPGYLAHAERGLAAGDVWYSDYGVQLTRGFRALKVWMSFKEHGLDRYGRLIQQNVDQARYLEQLIGETADLELLAPVSLNIVCFRYVGAAPGADLDALNRELLARLHESGVAVPSYATLQGRFGLRVAITNHRSRREDFDLLVAEVRRIGAELAN